MNIIICHKHFTSNCYLSYLDMLSLVLSTLKILFPIIQSFFFVLSTHKSPVNTNIPSLELDWITDYYHESHTQITLFVNEQGIAGAYLLYFFQYTCKYFVSTVVVLKLNPLTASPLLRDAWSCFLTWVASDCITKERDN